MLCACLCVSVCVIVCVCVCVCVCHMILSGARAFLFAEAPGSVAAATFARAFLFAAGLFAAQDAAGGDGPAREI